MADTVVLKNGDHLTGSVTQLAGGKLTVHTRTGYYSKQSPFARSKRDKK